MLSILIGDFVDGSIADDWDLKFVLILSCVTRLNGALAELILCELVRWLLKLMAIIVFHNKKK